MSQRLLPSMILLLALHGCTGASTPDPTLVAPDLPDGWGFGDISQGEGYSPELEDGTDHSGTNPDGLLFDAVDSLHPDQKGEIEFDVDDSVEYDISQCTPRATFCLDGDLVICLETGDGVKLAQDCDDGNVCTVDDCVAGQCVHEKVEGNCCNPPCPFGSLCVGGQCLCTPKCMGKECGDDGCGGSCGKCPDGYQCSLQGQCACTPKCDGKQCGDDGCGGSCGGCMTPSVCKDGICECVPQCEGKQCGDDGCGGSCGTCPALHQCQGGICQFNCPACPSPGGCTKAFWNNRVYYLCTNSSNWGKSRDECKKFGAYLATISSQDENAFLTSMLPGGGSSAWIGYYQDWVNWKWDWRWVVDEGSGFTAWDSNQPDDGNFWVVEDCTELKGNGKWNDNECPAKRHYFCEYVPNI